MRISSVCKLSLSHKQNFNLISQSGWNTLISAQSRTSACQFETIMVIFISVGNNSGTLIIRLLLDYYGGRVGLVVRALAFHLCGPGSISALGVICGLSLLVLYSAMRGFPQVLRFSPLTKNQHLI